MLPEEGAANAPMQSNYHCLATTCPTARWSTSIQMEWLRIKQQTADLPEVKKIAEELHKALSTKAVKNALTLIPAIGASSHQVDALVQPPAAALGFTSQKKG